MKPCRSLMDARHGAVAAALPVRFCCAEAGNASTDATTAVRTHLRIIGQRLVMRDDLCP